MTEDISNKITETASVDAFIQISQEGISIMTILVVNLLLVILN